MTTIDIDRHRYYDMSFMQIINLKYESVIYMSDVFYVTLFLHRFIVPYVFKLLSTLSRYTVLKYIKCINCDKKKITYVQVSLN